MLLAYGLPQKAKRMMISARNQIDATVEELQKGPVNVLALLESHNGTKMAASISTMSTEAMQLKCGDKIIALFQASHVLIATGWALEISARNKFYGVAESICIGSVDTEVVVRLNDSNDTLRAVITNDALVELDIKAGDEVVAIVKASEVMIAK